MRSVRTPLTLLALCIAAILSPIALAQDSPRSISELRRDFYIRKRIIGALTNI